ncbi:MAG: AtpZ/AtpI family protein [Chitinophagaceae bacterium]|nr:AtpZ/AtpI family protein [Chitinophagaceae bacterium]
MATQFMATLGVAFFIGYHADRYFHLRLPIFTITLPLAALMSVLWKIYQDSKPS